MQSSVGDEVQTLIGKLARTNDSKHVCAHDGIMAVISEESVYVLDNSWAIVISDEKVAV